ncbi:putative monooxygenase [Mycolicibacterium insubricum]|uniref:4-hydroxyacetophenone monooxygenase n=1 Tax=Mycolicibacterium insubricum TaxID=444597 RepID=A0A1X0DCP0_9MYCO|nr:NAD(P)/FAD-dependent oxidoreductase [Mycolicibacterium insubricum]MCV7083468.1 NAD(P)/FAD-dependent oxidoreductase [Mycolicibacterium insubricum]ORA70127.1 4-hydroxyacetophenone monooxygenase [Mycolicibacterium insubricum]BBZ68675.1 putative monooxygenase [Mycolicibacterium insubricum]
MTISVAIIGAGFAGIGAAIRLKDRGITDFVIYERDTRVGGTWRDNTYPGAACDIPSHLYSYSFAPKPDWSHTYSGSAEILEYIDHMVESSGVAEHIRFGHTVDGVAYDAEAGEWIIDFAEHQPLRARCVIVASGPLSNASFPNIPGIDDYEGHKIHSARWDHDYAFTGKRVAVVGTGASGVQIIPELVKVADSVKVFQRTPGWVLPRLNARTSSLFKRILTDVPLAQKAVRAAWYWGHESVALGVVWDTPLTRLVETLSTANLRLQVKDPWLRRQLTPDFSAGCKRLLMTSEYYPALQADNCKLVTWPIARLSAKGIRTVEGIEHQFDAIVFATGFDVSKAGTPFRITGADGRDLASEWSRGAFAYRSVAVSGYPNLYFTFGPNSGPGHNSALVYMEAQIDYIVEAISKLFQFGWKALDVRPEAQDRYNENIQQRLQSTTWNSGCQSWYLTEDGFNATMFPGFATQYVNQLKTVDLDDFKITAAQSQSGLVPAG